MEDVVLLKITLLTKTRKLTDQNRFNMIQLNMENVVLLKITLLTKTRKLTDQNRVQHRKHQYIGINHMS
jgi:hypothetical protein